VAAPARRRRPRAGDTRGRTPTGGETRRRNRTETVAAIVAAASELIARKGPDGFGLAELGERAGVSFGLIHRYFGGKDGLLREAMRDPLRRQLARVEEMYARGEATGSPAPVVSSLLEGQRRNPQYVRLLAWGVLSGRLTPDLFAGERTAVARLLAHYEREIHPAQDVDPRAVSALLLCATLGFHLFGPLLHGLLDVDASFDAVYRRHLETALAAFRAPRRGSERALRTERGRA
jgi:TetR/AcrR family transcriptional regulator, repressor for neighboring sulfatase